LSSVLDVHATEGNLNNQVGVPLTLLSLADDAHVAVVEMGTSLPGEIATLRDIALPEIALVTSVAEGHLEGLGSLEGVMQEKSSIFLGAQVAITPASQPEIGARASRLAKHVIDAGLGSGVLAASSWGTGTGRDGAGWLEVEGVRVRVPLRGAHNLRNAMLALAVARECGVAIARAAEGISGMQPRSMRMEAVRLGGAGRTGALLINDAYNSNPGSAAAAIEYLQEFPAEGQRVVVLGGMRELGASSRELHDRIAKLAMESNADVIAGMGEFAAAFHRIGAADPRLVMAPDVDELWERLRERLVPGATILLKASRGERLERIVPHLQKWADS
jgi:UDP-N-acetylmuramoyl-tripeptide--D-alanyl-D-alanine ligase